MTTRIVVDRLVVDQFPFVLNPVRILDELVGVSFAQDARFHVSLVVRYTPSVSTSTPGQAFFSASIASSTQPATIAAHSPSVCTPVWKGCELIVPKDLLNPQRRTTSSQQWLYLNAAGFQGTVDISTTILATVLTLRRAVNPVKDLQTLFTQCYVGPILAGFSLVFCLPQYLQPSWTGRGYAMNYDMRAGRGITGNNLYIKTPGNKDYVAIVIGSGGVYDWKFQEGVPTPSFKTFKEFVWEYDNKESGSNNGMAPNYFGSWTAIRGSANWWAEIRPRYTEYNIGGNYIKWYYPVTMLILYYEYPGVDVFDRRFEPSIKCDPDDVPCPSAGQGVQYPSRVPLSNATMQCLWNPHWKPTVRDSTEGIELTDEFSSAKDYLLRWPVYSNARGGDRDEPEGWRTTHGPKKP